MRTLYRDILSLVLLEGEPALALLADLEPPQERDPKRLRDTIESWFPENCDVRFLRPGEAFLQDMEREISQLHYDRVFLFPPFIANRRLSDQLRDTHPRFDFQEIALSSLANRLGKGVRVGTLLPKVSLAGRRSTVFRAQLFSEVTPKLIIDHGPFGSRGTVFSDHFVPVPMVTLVMVIGEPNDEVIRFFRYGDESSQNADDVLADLRKLLRRGGGKTQYGYVRRDPIPLGAPLEFERYHPDLLAKREDMRHFGDLRPLSDLVDTRMGLLAHHLEAEDGVLGDEEAQGIPVISGRNIRSDGSLDLDRVRQHLLKENLANLQPGDLCIPSLFSASIERLPVVDISADDLPLAADSRIIILRPKEGTSPAERELLTAFLKSARALEFLRADQAGISISLSTLGDIMVPVPDDALSLSIRGLNSAIDSFRLWQQQAEETRSQLFYLFDEYASAKQARVQLLATGRIARQRVEAAQRVTDFAHRVRTQYPHPLAYRWRRLQSSRHDYLGYRALLECAEATVCYLVFMVLTLTRSLQGVEIGYLDTMAERLSSSNPRGTNMGDWIAILREANKSRKLSRIEELLPFYEVLHLLQEKPIDAALQRLKVRRDDDAHGRGPEEANVQTEFAEAQEDLIAFLRAIEFVAEYPLRFVEVTRRDSMLGITNYEYRDLMGDHPLVPIAMGESKLRDLEAESLYLVDRTGDLHLLRPLLTRERCSVCGRWATFFLDRYHPGEDRCTLKSLEVGHTIQNAEIAQAFRHVGLLRSQD